MAWLRFLSNVSLLVTVGVDAIVLCHVIPAFHRTKNKAFLFIAIAAALGIIDTVHDHTVTLGDVTAYGYIFVRTLRRFAYFTDSICWCIGIVLLARPYLQRPTTPANDDTIRPQPCASPNGGPAVPLGGSGASEGPPSVS